MSEALVPLAEAPNQVVAELWCELLANEGMKSVISAADAVSFLGVTALPCRLMVARADLERAREVLASLQPLPDESETGAGEEDSGG